MMPFLAKKAESRREFFRSAARYVFLAMLAGVASLAARTQTFAAQRCVNRGVCDSCGVFASCSRPRAVAARSRNS
jgi:hypothetical protein